MNVDISRARLAGRREALQLTWADMAKKSRIPLASLFRYARDGHIPEDRAFSLAEALQMEVGDLAPALSGQERHEKTEKENSQELKQTASGFAHSSSYYPGNIPYEAICDFAWLTFNLAQREANLNVGELVDGFRRFFPDAYQEVRKWYERHPARTN